LKYDFFKIIKNRLSGFFFYETITLSFIGMLFCFLSCAQCLPKQKFWDSLNAIKENAALLSSQKLEFVCKLKQRFEACNSEKDSVYAKILHTIGVYEYLSNNDYKKAIIYTLGSLKLIRQTALEVLKFQQLPVILILEFIIALCQFLIGL